MRGISAQQLNLLERSKRKSLELKSTPSEIKIHQVNFTAPWRPQKKENEIED